jgi:hypothetical protein
MDRGFTDRHTDLRFLDKNASNSIRRNNQPDSIETAISITETTQDLSHIRDSNELERRMGKGRRFAAAETGRTENLNRVPNVP